MDPWVKSDLKLVAQEYIVKLVPLNIFLKIICLGFLMDVGLISWDEEENFFKTILAFFGGLTQRFSESYKSDSSRYTCDKY